MSAFWRSCVLGSNGAVKYSATSVFKRYFSLGGFDQSLSPAAFLRTLTTNRSENPAARATKRMAPMDNDCPDSVFPPPILRNPDIIITLAARADNTPTANRANVTRNEKRRSGILTLPGSLDVDSIPLNEAPIRPNNTTVTVRGKDSEFVGSFVHCNWNSVEQNTSANEEHTTASATQTNSVICFRQARRLFDIKRCARPLANTTAIPHRR